MSQLQIKILSDKDSLGRAGAEHAARSLRRAIQDQGNVRIIAATGASQFEFLDALTSAPAIDWDRVEVFHLDEEHSRRCVTDSDIAPVDIYSIA